MPIASAEVHRNQMNSVHNVLSHQADRQTDRQTDKQTRSSCWRL